MFWDGNSQHCQDFMGQIKALNNCVHCIDIYDKDTTKQDGWPTADKTLRLVKDVEILVGFKGMVFQDVTSKCT